MSRYLLENGDTTCDKDPDRTVWYSTRCGYWTDDWDTLFSTRGIPCCPKCRMVGFQTIFFSWMKVAREHDEDNTGYLNFLMFNKEKCFGRNGLLRTFERLKTEQN